MTRGVVQIQKMSRMKSRIMILINKMHLEKKAETIMMILKKYLQVRKKAMLMMLIL